MSTAPADDRPRREDWLEQLDPLLSVSLAEAGRRLTKTPAIQSWLHGDALEAAMPPSGGLTDLEARAMAYRYVLDDLKARFPELPAAIDEATAGCGHLELNWRPLAPDYSTLALAFDRDDIKADVFVRLTAHSADEAQRALAAVAAALPEGRPFPKRPNTATGLVIGPAKDETPAGPPLGVRVLESLTESGRRRSVTLLPAGSNSVEGLSETDAPRRLLDLLRRSA